MVHRLEGDVPAERLLHRLVDDPHAAAAQLAEDAELPQPIGHGAGLAGAPAELLHHPDGREQAADPLLLVGVAGDVLGDRRGLAAAAPEIVAAVRRMLDGVRDGELAPSPAEPVAAARTGWL